MQPHIAETMHTNPTTTKIADRRRYDRQTDMGFVVTRYVVVLNLGPVCRAQLINESVGGIAIQIGELDESAAVGQAIEVIFRGKRHGAEIRHITENEDGFLVGLQWKKSSTQ